MYTASSKRLWAWVEAAIDTLQTLPSFVYLMPAVMLFRVGDFTAMLAVVAYAVSPVIRYTALGLQRVPDNLIEAGRANGCTEWQLMTKIRLKLALPEIMLGINQTVMLALSMLVITALVGTRDLGQEVYIALDQGRLWPWSGCRTCRRLHCHHCRQAYHRRLTALARPAWSFSTGGNGMTAARDRIAGLDIWPGSVTIELLKGGLSNESYTVTSGTEKFVVRLGSDYPFHHVARDRELMTARAAYDAGFAPEVVYAEPGMMVSRFIDGTTYGETDVRANIAEIARLMRRFHEEMPAHVSGPGFMFWVFHVIRDYGHTLVAGNSRWRTGCRNTSNWQPSLRRCKSPCLSCSGTTTCCRPISSTMGAGCG
jgi:hypothetical protein